MARWLGRAVSVIAAFAFTWGVMILYWRSSGRTPTGMEMLMWLGVAPIAVSGGGWMLRSALHSGMNRALNADITLPSTAKQSGVRKPVAIQQTAVAAASLHTWLGLGADAWLNDGHRLPLPPLSSTLRDARGLPVQACEVDALEAQYGDVLASATGAVRVHEQRALMLLQPVLETLLHEAYSRLPIAEHTPEVVVAGLRRNDTKPLKCSVTIELLVPQTWGDTYRHWLADWLHKQAQQMGFEVGQFDIQVTVLASVDAVWERLRHIAVALEQDAMQQHLLLAASSYIDAQLLAEWDASGRLATAERSAGDVPGEGAAGVLLSSHAAAKEQDAWLCLPQLVVLNDDTRQRPAALRRHCVSAVTEYWESTGLAPDSLQFSVHDATLHGDAALHAASVAVAVNPDLNPVRQGASLRASAGELGLVLPLAQLALAQAQIQQRAESVLVQSVAAGSAFHFSLLTPSPLSRSLVGERV